MFIYKIHDVLTYKHQKTKSMPKIYISTTIFHSEHTNFSQIFPSLSTDNLECMSV